MDLDNLIRDPSFCVDYELIQKCQLETLIPNMVVEWVPYSNLENIKYLTKGRFSKIYISDWINGRYDEWDSGKKQLRRVETWNTKFNY
ncbi:hypothetical protein C1646_752269 [Rhizophagus diaphanus]|nr:hypothetical protein C1646_752269 [Rhizophagus diaphanus] [Rhizophagus sp. MUCL 43196]